MRSYQSTTWNRTLARRWACRHFDLELSVSRMVSNVFTLDRKTKKKGWVESFPGDTVIKTLPANKEDTRDEGSVPESGRSFGEGWQPTPVFLPEKFHGQRRLWGHGSTGESGTTEQLNNKRENPMVGTHTIKSPICQLSGLLSLHDCASYCLIINLLASLILQMVKNPPAMLEPGVWSLGREDPLEKGKAIHSSILAWWATVHGITKSWIWLSD